VAIKTMKKKNKKANILSDESITGLEPDWKGSDTWTAEKYYRERARTPYYYSYYYKSKDFVPWVVQYMKDNGYSKEDIKSYKAAEDWRTKSTLAGYVRALSKGMPENHAGIPEYLDTLEGITATSLCDITDSVKGQIEEVISFGKIIKEEKKEEEQEKVNTYKPSIQQLLFNKSLEMSEEIDEYIEEFDGSSSMLTTFDPQRMLLIVGAKPNHAKIIASLYQPTFDDFSELVNPPSTKGMSEFDKDMHEQLKEGYSHLSKSVIKNQFKMYKSIMDACDNIVLKGKVTRKPRKKKIVSAEKQVKNFKYLDHHPETKSISVNPADLVGANAAIVYNSKTRKLGIYHAQNIDPMGLKRDGSGLSVKGTTIQGFDEKTSVCKTLRKPIEQLAKFKKIAKRSLNKEFTAINSVEVKMNGRFNDHSLIIKVF
jgi:methyltransferase-like protein